MTIRRVYCIRRRDEVIVGVGTVHEGSSGQDVYQYWRNNAIFLVQDKPEIDVIETETGIVINDCGMYIFEVRNPDESRRIELRITKNGDDYVITEPSGSDQSLLTELPECGGEIPFRKFFEKESD